MVDGRSVADDAGAFVVVVEMLTGCAVMGRWVVVVVVAVAVAVAVAVVAGAEAEATRIQHRTPRFRPRAPSTPFELVIPGLVMNWREIRLSTP